MPAAGAVCGRGAKGTGSVAGEKRAATRMRAQPARERKKIEGASRPARLTRSGRRAPPGVHLAGWGNDPAATPLASSLDGRAQSR